MSEREEWRPVVGYEGSYEVSSLGRVRSLPHEIEWVTRWGTKARRPVPGKVLRPDILRTGYHQVTLYVDGGPHRTTVHRLVCAAFHGCPPNANSQVAHYNGRRADNRAANLRWASWHENRDDMARHGTAHQGERHHNAKLTEDDVRAIRAHTGGELKTLAAFYGVNLSVIEKVRSKKSWRHL